jgi:DNA helicase-2/ATP-dependent DNA helicase PcrA
MSQELNQPQERAVKHSSGPLLIVAGAGSGKTRTLTYRIAHLIKSGIRPERILAITFTNKAANEMKERVQKLLAGFHYPLLTTHYSLPTTHYPLPTTHYPLPFLGTFHSWGARFLRREAARLGRTADFSIFDNDDSRRLIKEICKFKDIPKDKYNPAVFETKISKIKNELLDPADLRLEMSPLSRLSADVCEAYESALKRNNAFDFDDLIAKPALLLLHDQALLENYRRKYDHILVDEYQDTNPAQYRLIKLLAGVHKNLSVVGDDAQSIYGFRFSDFRNFLNFDKDWPDATVVTLEENYRSTGNIIAAASALISHNTLQKPKSLWTQNENGRKIHIFGFGAEDDEAYFVVARVMELFRSPNADPEVAILYRTNAQSRALEHALMQNGIPYRIYGGLRFYDRMEIKDMLSAFQLAANPSNELAAERLRKNFNKKEAVVLLEELPRLGREGKIVDIINFFLETTDYINYLSKEKNGDERIENVNELIAFAGTFNHLGLPAFLEQVSLVASVDLPNGRPDSRGIASTVVTLLTAHAAKGLEFNQVFVAGCSEGLLPHERSLGKDEDLEEERRLMYVAMTRARRELTLTFYGTPSRFLYEIPAELTEYKDFSSNRRKSLTSFEDEDFIEYD